MLEVQRSRDGKVRHASHCPGRARIPRHRDHAGSPGLTAQFERSRPARGLVVRADAAMAISRRRASLLPRLPGLAPVPVIRTGAAPGPCRAVLWNALRPESADLGGDG
jgi:hypothetical protein